MRRLRALCLIGIVAALTCGLWAWHEYTRPGRVHYRRGMDEAAAHQFRQATLEWQAGVREDPTFSGCYEKLGDLGLQVGDYPDAAASYAAAARLSPRDGTLFLRLARAQQSAGDLPAAAASALRATQLRPDDGGAWSLYAFLENQLKDLPAALAALRRARQLRPDDRDDLLALANLEMDVPDMAAAERDLTPWLKAHPDDIEACYRMGVVYSWKPRTPDNVRIGTGYAERVVATRPRDPRPYALLGQFYLDAGRPQDALRTYLAIAPLQANDEDILHGLVECYTRLGQSRQATAAATRLNAVTARRDRIKHLEFIARLNPSDIGSGLELARLQEEDGQLDPAEATYRRLVRAAPHDPRTRPALATFYRRMGRGDLARRAANPDFVP